MIKTILILLLLTKMAFAQFEPFPSIWFGKSKKVEAPRETVFVLQQPASRWTDTTEYPPTPYVDGWAKFNGYSSVMMTGHQPYFNLQYSIIDSFRIEFEYAYVAPYKSAVWFSSFDPISGGGWYIGSGYNYGVEFYMPGTGAVEVAPMPNTDTLFHSYKIIFTKNNNTLRCYKDDVLLHTYTSYTFNSVAYSSIYAFCIGNRIEVPTGCSYVNSYTYSTPATCMRGSVRSFSFGKNDSLLTYKFNGGSRTQVYPLLKVGGNVVRPLFPFEYDDRWRSITLDGSYILRNGIATGIDTMDATFYVNGIKSNYRDPYIDMNYGISSWNNGKVWCEPYGGQASVINNELYIVFDGNSANGLSPGFPGDRDTMNRVSKWTGTEWAQVSHGFSGGGGMFITEYNNEPIALGYFTQIVGGAATNYSARFNGTAWVPMGTGLNSVGFSGIEAYGNLYVGGFFTTAGGSGANHIAKWNGTTWSGLRNGVNSTVLEIEPYVLHGETGLLVGGVFTRFNNGSVDDTVFGLAFWNTTTELWSKVDSLHVDENRGVFDILQSTDGWTYLVGDYRQMQGKPIVGISRYKQDYGLQSIGSGLYHASGFACATAIVELGDIIYIGGTFTRINGVLSKNFAAWNKLTGEIIDVGYGTDMRVEGLCVWDNKIVIIGDQFITNGKIHPGIVVYDPALNVP